MYPKVAAQGGLPEQFSKFQPLVDSGWAEPERRDRTEKRLTSDFAEIKDFYDTVVPRLHELLSYLDQFPLKQLSDEQARLLQVAFMVAEVRNAVESFGQPDVVDGWDTRRFFIDEPLEEASA